MDNDSTPLQQDDKERVEELFLETLSLHGIFYMLVAGVLVLLWIYVDYITEYSHFKYFTFLRLSFSLPTLTAAIFYKTTFIQRNIRSVLFACYMLLTVALGLMVAVSDNLLLYSMGYSTVFLGTAVFLVWKARYIAAGIPVVAIIVAIHWPYLQAHHSLTDLTVVGAYMMNVLCISALFSFVIYRSFAKQFKLRWKNEQYEIKLAAQLEEVAEANKALEVANATKNKFFSIIAHDLRGPAGSLSIFFNDLIRSGADMDEAMLQAVRVTTKTLHNLLEQLLTWARSQQGRIEVKPETFVVGKPIAECVGLLDSPARQKGVSIINSVPDSFFVYADPALIVTVVRNLIGNAVKYTSDGDTITVSAKRIGESIEVSVEDTGIGMSPRTMEKLFKIDEKVESSRGTSDEEGTGLGLILCREFVEKNGGVIGVESEKGKGSRFWFTLPAAEKQEGTAEAGVVMKIEQLSYLKVLLAEDNVLHRKTSSVVLAELGVQLQIASDGIEAVEMAKSCGFDLILMDIDMPRMNGIEASREIERLSGRRPWIIALSSYSQKELQEISKSFPFNGYLNKPLAKDALVQVLQPLLNA